MRYIIALLLLGNIAYFGWNVFAPPASPPVAEPLPLRNEGLQLVSEFRAAELARLREQVEQLCLEVGGFADIFAASEFAYAVTGEHFEAAVYVEPGADAAMVRISRHVEDPENVPQWPDFASQGANLTAAENSCSSGDR